MAATPIPALSLIERMSVERAPVTAFAPNSVAARAYRALWSEILARITRAPQPSRPCQVVMHASLPSGSASTQNAGASAS